MGLLDNIKERLGRRSGSSSDDLILQSLGDICSVLVKHFDADYYRWMEPKEIRTFECLILSRFLIEHALEQTFSDKLTQLELSRYHAAIEERFRWLIENTFHNRFTYDRIKDTVINRLELYRQVLAEQSHPVCWQIIASILTGIDYPAENDVATLTASSMALPELLMLAQDALKLTIKC